VHPNEMPPEAQGGRVGASLAVPAAADSRTAPGLPATPPTADGREPESATAATIAVSAAPFSVEEPKTPTPTPAAGVEDEGKTTDSGGEACVHTETQATAVAAAVSQAASMAAKGATVVKEDGGMKTPRSLAAAAAAAAGGVAASQVLDKPPTNVTTEELPPEQRGSISQVWYGMCDAVLCCCVVRCTVL